MDDKIAQFSSVTGASSKEARRFLTKYKRLDLQLATDTDYFRHVYNYTFEFSRPPGQRSLALDMAQGFWALLIPHGLKGGALAHVSSGAGQDGDGDGDVVMGSAGEEGWKDEYTQWWFEFLESSGAKGVSKDVWHMFLEFVRTIDARFEKYDPEASMTNSGMAIDDRRLRRVRAEQAIGKGVASTQVRSV
ncbi:Cullin binding-domain-containing protein [Cubamyces lactineus]|nr:Cullin binding-domain-containing protein [Cubamyces lactineus]